MYRSADCLFWGRLCIGWKQLLLDQLGNTTRFPLEFCYNGMTWLGSIETYHTAPLQVSFLELTFGLVQTPGFQFPFLNGRGQWELWHLTDRMERPTFAYLYRFVRKVVCSAFRVCELEGLLLAGLDLTQMAVAFPCDGIWLALDRTVLDTYRASLVEFTRTRALRKACDLARPV